MRKVEDRDRIVVEFPMKRRTINATIATLLEQDGEKEIWKQNKCTVTFRGNTIIDVEPSLVYPIENHAKYRADKAPMKKVIRFVSEEKFLF